jgi:hypothetical protein
MKTVIDVLKDESSKLSIGFASEAINSVKKELASDLHLLEYRGELNEFTAHNAVLVLIRQRVGNGSNLYEQADKTYQLDWLGDILQKIQEPFWLYHYRLLNN